MIEIIPAIDIVDGKCVRLTQGDFSRPTTYSDNPVEVAQEFDAAGMKRLHIVDLDGAKNGRVTNLEILKQIARNTNLTIDFGGGIKTDEDIRSVFNARAQMASIGSVAVKDEKRLAAWLEEFGGERILLGADVRDGQLAIDGWKTATSVEILPFLQMWFERGVSQVFVTDIAKDGVLGGSSRDLYAEILLHLPELKLIASGGVSSMDDILELEEIGCTGVIVGKAIYERKITIEELTEHAGRGEK
jgi:phosphoribosylformimino-5-aminoimidazole carboxamide ribotide isomerase